MSILSSSSRSSLALPAFVLILSVISYLFTPPRHSLLTSFVAWLVIAVYTTSRSGARSLLDASPSQKLGRAAGTLLALAAVEERAVDGRSIWWAKVLPLQLMGDTEL